MARLKSGQVATPANQKMLKRTDSSFPPPIAATANPKAGVHYRVGQAAAQSESMATLLDEACGYSYVGTFKTRDIPAIVKGGSFGRRKSYSNEDRRDEETKAMTQAQLTAYLAGKVGIEKRQSKGLLDELTALVVKQLKKEGVLRLSGLGVFRKRKSKARMGRNPATGEQIKIPARTRLRFAPAKGLRDAVFGAR
jgi:DNA-binding protein HU-beta